MVGLDFVKKIDKDWEKNINRMFINNYNEEHCPFCGKIIQ